MKQSHPTFTEADREERYQQQTISHCILTPPTRTAITMLHTIASDGSYTPIDSPESVATIRKLLPLLTVAEIIHPVSQIEVEHLLSGYKLTRPIHKITLLDILKAISEHLDCNNETSEDLYNQHRQAASDLGIISHMTRFYLSRIKLSDL